MSLTYACCYCRRETHKGMAIGAPLLDAKYRGASHGFCLDCAEDFENGLTNETIVTRAQARTVSLVAPASEPGSKRGL